MSHRWVPAGHPQYTRPRKRSLWVAPNSTQRDLRETTRLICFSPKYGLQIQWFLERWRFVKLEVIQVVKQLEDLPGVRELQQLSLRAQSTEKRILVQKLWYGAQGIRYRPSLKRDRFFRCLKRPVPAPGYPPPSDRESFRHSATMVEKAGQRMRNVEKKSAEMAAKVEQARKALATAEQNRDANEKALAEARSHFHKTQQEHVVRFPSGCPLDNDVCAGQGAVLAAAAAANNKDASGDVDMGEVEAWPSSCRKTPTEQTGLFQSPLPLLFLPLLSTGSTPASSCTARSAVRADMTSSTAREGDQCSSESFAIVVI